MNNHRRNLCEPFFSFIQTVTKKRFKKESFIRAVAIEGVRKEEIPLRFGGVKNFPCVCRGLFFPIAIHGGSKKTVLLRFTGVLSASLYHMPVNKKRMKSFILFSGYTVFIDLFSALLAGKVSSDQLLDISLKIDGRVCCSIDYILVRFPIELDRFCCGVLLIVPYPVLLPIVILIHHTIHFQPGTLSYPVLLLLHF